MPAAVNPDESISSCRLDETPPRSKKTDPTLCSARLRPPRALDGSLDSLARPVGGRLECASSRAREICLRRQTWACAVDATLKRYFAFVAVGESDRMYCW